MTSPQVNKLNEVKMLQLILLFLAPFFIRNSHRQSLPSMSIFSCGLSSKSKSISWTGPIAKKGELATASEMLPWEVSIRSEEKHACGGVILSSWWILSVAHCFTEELPSDLHAVVKFSEDRVEKRKLDRVIIHEDFDGVNLINDIALILLDSPIDFNEEKTPICLPLLHDLGMWQDCWAATWRSTMAGTAISSLGPTGVLRKAEMTLISRETCSERVPGLAGDVLCAVSEESTKETCKDGSGGPLVCTYGNDVKWFVVGIASRGDACGGKGSPAVYTVVISYLDWIEETTAEEGKPFIPEGVDVVIARSEILIPGSASDPPCLSVARALAAVLTSTLFHL
ncbi:serine protease 55-like [Rhineura floridana]|uniref:serine protease 55-like n=1 Tax=Rhineura floridana TaxID=261503 RepID=UPI002AC83E42|nr:serine protease 55-like [Rhineura floridana]